MTDVKREAEIAQATRVGFMVGRDLEIDRAKPLIKAARDWIALESQPPTDIAQRALEVEKVFLRVREALNEYKSEPIKNQQGENHEET